MIRESRLENGLTLLTEDMPDLRSVAVGVWLRLGSRHEEARVNGICHFIEHLVFKGTERRTAREIAQAIDGVGGQMDAFTSRESTCFFLRVLDEHLDLALDLLADIVLHPRFAPEDIEKERNVIFEEIRMVEDSPEELLFDLLYQARWKDHPLGRPVQGSFETVGAMDRALLRSFFQKAYVPGNIVLAAAGRLEHQRVEEAVRQAFGTCARRPYRRAGGRPEERAVLAVREKREMEQLHLAVAVGGLPQSHEDRFVLMVLCHLLGGTMSSRLFQKVREERGLAYSVYSAVHGYADCGFQVIYAATQPSSAHELLKIISGELQDLKRREVSTEEIARSKENLKGTLMLSMESAASRMSGLARREIVFGRQYDLAEILAGIEAVSAADLLRLGRQAFASPAASLALLGQTVGARVGLEDLVF
ncbi:MAG: M16 family metallopeptidase [Acidobacteriota bacterium]